MITSIPSWLWWKLRVPKEMKISLKEWYKNETDYARLADAILWILFFDLMSILAIISKYYSPF